MAFNRAFQGTQPIAIARPHQAPHRSLHGAHAKRGPTLLSAPTAPDLAFRIVDPMPVKAVSRLKMVCLPRRERWG
ncbi:MULTISPECIES: hypothetical protein [Pseudomonadota]|jgi:hypothetical protein|uniref:hypothetical protein n=1 Tax=Pseudomonadota TaxID=1224 RepID=UPI000AAD24D7|nr:MULTISPECIES: hypothetical protein [Pseudomonadota]|tara:strand:- start:209131 stop:209355 length:225 start_codon:yes stop_codon:yes gene_type:complete